MNVRLMVASDEVGKRVEAKFLAHNWEIEQRLIVQPHELKEAIALLSTSNTALCLVGLTGHCASGMPGPGFGEAVRALSGREGFYYDLGLVRVNGCEVFWWPEEATDSVMQVLGEPTSLQAPEQASAHLEEEKVESTKEVSPAPPALPLFRRQPLSIGLQAVEVDGELPEGAEVGSGGWRAAVTALGATIEFESREELPWSVEKFAPLVDVLHQAGQQAVLTLPNGRRYSLWGFPDLQRPGAKVLALGWGEPLCELIALHRFPVLTGIWVEKGVPWLHGKECSEVAHAVTGRACPGGGHLFASDGEKVWLSANSEVRSWDGRREREEGTMKSVLASLALFWSAR